MRTGASAVVLWRQQKSHRSQTTVSPEICPLLHPLAPEQAALIWTIYEPFDQSREWSAWQYTDLTLDERGLDAAIPPISAGFS